MDSLTRAREVAAQYTESDGVYTIEPVGASTINKTYIAKPSAEESTWFVLQRMHSIFTPPLMADIENVTKFITERGMIAPRVLHTHDGSSYVAYANEWWRALSYVEGTTIESVDSNTNLESVGKLVGDFHTNLLEYNTPFSFRLENFHNTQHYLKRLQDVVRESRYKNEFEHDVLFITQELEPLLKVFDTLPKRVIHADLKISNIRFDTSGLARSLIDLDTLMMHHVAIDLGDGLRSWCARGDEDTEGLIFDKERYERAYRGYIENAPFLTDEEKASIPQGLLLITLELSARFITDACEQSYFRLQESKYTSLYEQNKQKAQGQLSLYRSMCEQGMKEYH